MQINRFNSAVGETQTTWVMPRCQGTATLFPRVNCNEYNLSTVRKNERMKE